MGPRRARLHVWVPAGYLALVVGLLVWVDVLVRTGDAGFAGVWPLLATAPLSVLALGLIVPDPASLGSAEAAPPVHTGPVPPEPLPAPVALPEAMPEAMPEAVPDLAGGGAELSDAWLGFGFYGVVLACALVNATALWALGRGLSGLLARRRREPGPAATPGAGAA
ncbi:hypothetical protein [Streptomyces sp. NPDC048606]|uniref:SCO4225 family membrane protein n=1 Tax=Streptomyces sp. NPDC048606 TaxID=3154726 RepID=UPI003413AF4E